MNTKEFIKKYKDERFLIKNQDDLDFILKALEQCTDFLYDNGHCCCPLPIKWLSYYKDMILQINENHTFSIKKWISTWCCLLLREELFNINDFNVWDKIRFKGTQLFNWVTKMDCLKWKEYIIERINWKYIELKDWVATWKYCPYMFDLVEKSNKKNSAEIYYVFVENGWAPTVSHNNIYSAQKEAERIARKTNKKTFVLKAIKSYEPWELIEITY